MDLQTAQNILIVAAGLVTIALVGGALRLIIGRLLGHERSASTSVPAEDLSAELDALRARVEDLEQRGLVSGEVESQYARLAELEERVDFAERLLASPERLENTRRQG